MLRDLLYAFGGLARNPGFATVSILTLAVGIGANSAVFSLVDGMLFRPLPFHEPDRLAMIMGLDKETGTNYTAIPKLYADTVAGRHAGIEGLTTAKLPSLLTLLGNNGAETIQHVEADVNLLDVLGVVPTLGRRFVPADAQPGAPPVGLLTWHAWQRRFGGDSAMVGRTLEFEEKRVQIVGVLPRTFIFPFGIGAPEILLPEPDDVAIPSRANASVFTPIVRLRPGVSLDRAQAELDGLVSAVAQIDPQGARPPTLQFLNLQYALSKLSRRVLWLLLGASMCVLLIACANVTNLLLFRGTTREREFAVRTALGAGRWRLFRQLATESVPIAVLGGAVALMLASWTLDLITPMIPVRYSRLGPIAIDDRAMGFTLGISFLAVVLSGVIPALSLSRPDLAVSLRPGPGYRFAPASHFRLGTGLVVAEVALGVVLLACTGLLANSVVRMRAADLGFQPDRLIVAQLSPPTRRYPTVTDRTEFFRRALERLRHAQGVMAVAGIDISQTSYALPMAAIIRTDRSGGGRWRVTSGYFAAMGTRIVEGRDFNDRETQGDVPVGIVNQAAAARFWPGQSALGQILQLDAGEPPRRIVGVVENVRGDYGKTTEAALYLPFEPTAIRSMEFVVRTTREPDAALAGSAPGALGTRSSSADSAPTGLRAP